MKESEFRVSVFGFKENNDLWNHINFIIDENIKQLTDSVSDINKTNEERVHVAGSLHAMLAFRDTLTQLRSEGVDITGAKENEEDA